MQDSVLHISFWEAGLVLALLICGAALLDGLLGSKRLFGHFPDPDTLLISIAYWFQDKLDRENRTKKARRLRGIIAPVFLILIAGLVGTALDTWVWHDMVAGKPFAPGFALMSLVFLMRQKIDREYLTEIAKRLADTQKPHDENAYVAARWASERVLLGYYERLITNGLILTCFGFTGLFAYRMLSAHMTAAGSDGLTPPQSPYAAFTLSCYELVSFIPSHMAAGLLKVSGYMLPSKFRHAVEQHAHDTAGKSSARIRVVSAITYMLHIALPYDRDTQGTDNWCGPHGARARLTARDCRHIVVIARIASTAFCLLLVLIFTYGTAATL